MNNMFSVLFSVLRSRFMGLWNRLKMWLRPTFWVTRGIGLLRKFFSVLFNVKPRHKKDYYTVFRWLISKRLAFALVIGAGALGIWYILAMSPLAVLSGSADSVSKIPTYKYNALPLKFHSGQVQILAADNHVAYIGGVSDGRANGNGQLFDAGDALIYSGTFKDSMYEGYGELYGAEGALLYAGMFSKNLYHGDGVSYRPGGTMAYKGGYVNGLRSGQGELYNAGGNKIFTGLFQADELVYAELVGKTVTDAASMYTGQRVTYATQDEYCVEMQEIDAVYAVTDGENALDEDWRIDRVYVLRDTIMLGGKQLSSLRDISGSFGAPDYTGQTLMTLSDAVSVNLARQDQIATVEMEQEAPFDDVYMVTDYDSEREIFVYVYKTDGLVYTFFCESSGANDFVMYSIEQDAI